MATVYSLFLGFLSIALCSDDGNQNGFIKQEAIFCRSIAAAGPLTFVLTQKSAKSQGCIPLCDPFSKILNKIELASRKQNFVFNGFCSKVLRSRNARPSSLGSAGCSVVSERNDLLAYGGKGSEATVLIPLHLARNKGFQSKGGDVELGTLGRAIVAERSHFDHRLTSLDLCGTFYQEKVPRQSANEDKNNLRNKIMNIATGELGVREATGQNDGKRVEEYLAYTNLGKGHQWCAAFVSWCYGQAGLPEPRNPWSPALFPKARTYRKQGRFMGLANLPMDESAFKADIFGIYGLTAKRINHVGLIREKKDKYLMTIEGNSNNRVESRRRHLSTIYALAEWISQ